MLERTLRARRAGIVASLSMMLFAVSALAMTTGAAGGAQAQQACATGDAATAAATLYGAGTELVGTEQVAGLRTANVLEPRIYPGTRRKLVAAGSQWCDAATGFNRAWQASGRAADGRSMAEAYAKLAAAPYFDDVTVKTLNVDAAGAYIVTTHARTNGIDARWTIKTDADGIRSATWTATAFAQAPFEAQTEGLSALPGATETYTRVADGVLVETRGLPTAASAQASHDSAGLAEHTFEDGYKIVVSVGDAHVGVNPGTNTGVSQADKLRATLLAAVENYNEFRSWGLSKGWRPLPGLDENTGYIYVNDALSLYCWACVFISDDFQIHILSEVNLILNALGYDGYRDANAAYRLVIGHEMFHNFQNRYNKPGTLNQGGRGTPASYSEGTARFQETLHTYYETTFAPNTLVTAEDTNGCNGFDVGGMDAGMAAGPFGKTYNTCYLWGSWYVSNGKQAFLNLVREGIPANSPEPDAFLEISRAATQASGKPIADQLAEFAGSAITGHGRTWSTWFGNQAVDWGSLLERWAPSVMAPGSVRTRSLGPGGMMAAELTTGARITVSGSGAVLYLLRDVGTKVKKRVGTDGYLEMRAPLEGERIYVVAIRPVAGTASVTLKVDPVRKVDAPPVGTAQPPVTGSVIARAPGAGNRIGGVTSDYLVFQVVAGADNASGQVTATYPLPGDIDLFLQRQNGTTWSDVGPSGETSLLNGESMSFERLEPGTYRIEVHNWAGPPNPVSVTARFFNSAGQAGT